MNQILPRYYRYQQQREASQAVDRAVREAVDPEPVPRATLGGDTRRLRGIPVIGHGIGGTQPGSDPLGHTIRRLQSDR